MSEFINITTFTMAFTFIGVLAIGAAKAYERITGTNSEGWDANKFGLFVVVAGAIMIVEYSAAGSITFPADGVINAAVTMFTPIAALFGTTYAALIGGKLVKNQVVIPVVASIVNPVTTQSVAVPKPTQVNLPDGGCEVTPSIAGKVFHLIYGLVSPVVVKFDFEATQVTTDHSGYVSVDVDWDDGTVQNIPLVAGKGSTEHTFIFKKNGKYTGYTFNPVFTFNESTGEKFVVNGDGRSVEIGVESQ